MRIFPIQRMQGVLALFLVCTASAWAALAISNPRPIWGTPQGLDRVLAGVPSRIVIPIKNRSVHALQIQSAQTTCGCVQIVSAPGRIPALASRDIVLEARVDPANPLLRQWLFVILADGRELRFLIQGEALPIVSGWPEQAWARRLASSDSPTGELLAIRIQEPYREHVKTIAVLDPDDQEIAAAYDRIRGEILVAADHRRPHMLVLSIRRADTPDWVAPIRIRNEGEGDD